MGRRHPSRRTSIRRGRFRGIPAQSMTVPTSGVPKASSSACSICGQATTVLFEKNGFPIRHCPDCGFLFVYPAPADGTAHIYSADYFHGALRGFGYTDYEADKIAMRPFFERVLDIIESHVSRGRLLDIGAATGFFLNLARERGWVVAGVEISDYAAKVAPAAGFGFHAAPAP